MLSKIESNAMSQHHSDPNFKLDPRLESDTSFVTRLDLCRVLLMEDARFPWIVMVPERTDVTEIIDLCEIDRTQLFVEICAVSRAIQLIHAPHKLNIAALGNQVRQCHVHVIARQTDDAAWPAPVWGVGKAEAYNPQERQNRSTELRTTLSISSRLG